MYLATKYIKAELEKMEYTFNRYTIRKAIYRRVLENRVKYRGERVKMQREREEGLIIKDGVTLLWRLANREEKRRGVPEGYLYNRSDPLLND